MSRSKQVKLTLFQSEIFGSYLEVQHFLDELPTEQYRKVKCGQYEILECRRSCSYRSRHNDCSQAKVCGRPPLTMDRKCLSRIFISHLTNGSISFEWIRTHTFHNPDDEHEMVFKSLPRFIQRDIFNQYTLGVTVTMIMKNIQTNIISLRNRSNTQVYRHISG